MTAPRRPRGDAPGPRRVVHTLKDGYWDRSEVVELDDGSRRVRKRSQGNAPPGPWGVEAPRKQIEYLSTLSEAASGAFPPLLCVWDNHAASPPDVGYEVPFYSRHTDAGRLCQRAALTQGEVDTFQTTLADTLFERVHRDKTGDDTALSTHLVSVVEHALDALEQDPTLAPLIGAETLRLNGQVRTGPRVAFERLRQDEFLRSTLDAEPQVCLHGDCFLENILWRAPAPPDPPNPPSPPGTTPPDPEGPLLLLIDPVSVAGVMRGPPLFDLVKYESYATGELPALRSEWVDVDGFDGFGEYQYRVRWQAPELEPFRARDWHTLFRSRFEARYGSVDPRVYRLIDGYFSVAMAVNTSGVQRRARLLKATLDFNAASASS
jgi:hypothetical protein